MRDTCVVLFVIKLKAKHIKITKVMSIERGINWKEINFKGNQSWP